MTLNLYTLVEMTRTRMSRFENATSPLIIYNQLGWDGGGGKRNRGE